MCQDVGIAHHHLTRHISGLLSSRHNPFDTCLTFLGLVVRKGPVSLGAARVVVVDESHRISPQLALAPQP